MKVKTYNNVKINLVVKDNVDVVLLKKESKEDLKYKSQLFKYEPL